ncbi:MAG: MFS transporter, partial [Actinomycetota bacterium]
RPRATGFRPEPWRPAAALRGAGAALRDPVQLRLYGIAVTLMGAFVAFYNALGFRLQADPYGLSVSAVGAVYLAYAAGSAGSATVGAAADRWGRRPLMPVAIAVTAAGAALSAASPLAGVVAGTVVLTFGFFAAHGLASGWVADRAHVTGAATATASALYSVAYYVGATVPGALGPVAYSAGGWQRVLLLVGGLLAVAGVLALRTAGRGPRTRSAPRTG